MFKELNLVVSTTIVCVIIQTVQFAETVEKEQDTNFLAHKHAELDKFEGNQRILKEWHAEAPENHPQEAMSDVLSELAHGSSLETRLTEDMVRKVQKVEDLPAEFDARQKWKKCSRFIGSIYNGGPCRSDYAIVAASTLADRICIKSNGKAKALLSAQKVLGCYGSCKEGGFIWTAIKHLNESGTTTGGLFKPKRGCIPFEPPPCSHVGESMLGTGSEVALQNCSKIPMKEYECPKKCTNGKYKKTFEKDIRKTQTFQWTSTIAENIKREIYVNGSVAAGFSMYDDFRRYKRGVYEKDQAAKYEYIHKVKLIGWGKENGTAYWLGVNSFGKEWGLKGLFKIPCGRNYLFIETLCLSIIPRL
nr:PREDICTED: cathepsin B-like cysteine proteinase 4 isoform X2 [Bemisia tabaci]